MLNQLQKLEDAYYSGKDLTGQEFLELSLSYLDQAKEKKQTLKSSSKEYKQYNGLLKRAAQYAINAYKTKDQLSAIQIQKLIEVLTVSPNSQRNNTYITKLMISLLEMEGIKDIIYQKKVIGTIKIESGMLAVGDVSYSDLPTTISKEFKSPNILTQEGKLLVIGTGGDGQMGAEVRYTDGDYPLLTPKEYKISRGSSEEYFLDVITGNVGIADLYNLGDEANNVLIQIPIGVYKVRVYILSIPNKFFKYVEILARTDQKPINPNFDGIVLE